MGTGCNWAGTVLQEVGCLGRAVGSPSRAGNPSRVVEELSGSFVQALYY